MGLSHYGYLFIPLVGFIILLWYGCRALPRYTERSVTTTREERIVLSIILLLGTFVVYGRFFLGDSCFAYRDAGSDTSGQYVPYYLNFVDSIRDGDFGPWNFDYGLGASFMCYQSWTLDPFNLILVPAVLLMGDTVLPFVLVTIQALKIFLCGHAFDSLLTRYCELPLSRILGATLFGFCGYLMLWGQHYWLGSVLVMAVLLVLLLEMLMEKWTVLRFVGVMLTTALSVMMSTYSGFMIMLFATVYAVLRTISRSGCRTLGGFLKSFAPLAMPVICGLLVSMLTLVPYATLMLSESDRVTGGGESFTSRLLSALTGWVPLRWVPAILSRMLGSSLISSGEAIPETLIPPTDYFGYVNVYEVIQLGFSCGAFVLLGQFAHWAMRDAGKRDSVLIAVAAALCLLYCFNNFLPAFTNVFAAIRYRASFALAVPVCIALAVGWEKRVVAGDIVKVPFVLSVLVTLLIVFWSLVNTVNGRIPCVVYIACLLILVVCILAFLKGRARPSALTVALACIVVSSIIDGFFVTNQRETSSPADFSLAESNALSEETKEALTWLSEYDDGFYRVEKLYTDWTRLSDSLVQGYRGVTAYNSTVDSDIEVFYENLWPGMIAGDIAYQQYVNDPNQPELLRLLGVRYLLARDDLPFDWCTQIAEFGSTRVYEIASSSVATVYAGVMTESTASELSVEERHEVIGTEAIVPDEAITLLSSGLNAGGSPSRSGRDFALDGNSRITGTVETSSEVSIVCLAIPNTIGWDVTVDGESVQTFRVNYGFTGFEIASPGEHVIEARFIPRGMPLGVAGAVLGGALALLSLFVTRRKLASNTMEPK